MASSRAPKALAGPLNIFRCRHAGALIKLADRDEGASPHASLRAARPGGVLKLLLAARTPLIRFDQTRIGVTRLSGTVTELPLADRVAQAAAEAVLPVHGYRIARPLGTGAAGRTPPPRPLGRATDRGAHAATGAHR